MIAGAVEAGAQAAATAMHSAQASNESAQDAIAEAIEAAAEAAAEAAVQIVQAVPTQIDDLPDTPAEEVPVVAPPIFDSTPSEHSVPPMPPQVHSIFYTTGSIGPNPNELRRVNTDGSGDVRLLGESDGLERPEGVVVDGPSGNVFVANMGTSGGIIKASLDGSNVQRLVGVEEYSGFAPQGVEIYRDGDRSTVFWADPDPDVHAVLAADAITGETVARFVEGRTAHVADVSIDKVHRQLYYADMLNHEIGIVGLDGELPQIAVSDIFQPVGVAVDGWSGDLFFSTVSEEGGAVYRADLNGGSAQVIQSHPSQWWAFLAVDPRTRTLFASEVHGRIVRMDYDGQNLANVIEGGGNSSFAGVGVM